MKKYSPREEIFKVLNKEKLGYFPRSILLFTPIVDMMEELGTYFPEANYEAGSMAKLALAAHEMANYRATMLPWASTVEMEALGCEVINNKDDIAAYPQFKRKAFESFEKVKFSGSILKEGILPVIFEAIKIVKEEIVKKYNDEIPIFPMIQGPFTIGVYSCGVNEMFKIMLKEPNKAIKALDIISDMSIAYANKMIEAGGDFLQMSDPAAEGLGEKEFANILLPVYQKISKEVKGKKVVHICGRTAKLLKYLPDSGFDGFSFDQDKIDLKKAKEIVGDKIKLVGSVPTVSHLLEGKENDVFNKTIEMIDGGTDIMAASCGLPQYSPLENILEMSKAIDHWNNTKLV